ncbi:hypothetical protein D515_04818 [Grimontia indica]|uniref:Uncharacterized protein n=1 Tax=Grimontia indica TaxID=1056512 RepID=R1GXQ5_9GAMM|nr:hypothetical protein D515_04818 [Grimontia indica]
MLVVFPFVPVTAANFMDNSLGEVVTKQPKSDRNNHHPKF